MRNVRGVGGLTVPELTVSLEVSAVDSQAGSRFENIVAMLGLDAALLRQPTGDRLFRDVNGVRNTSLGAEELLHFGQQVAQHHIVRHLSILCRPFRPTRDLTR